MLGKITAFVFTILLSPITALAAIYYVDDSGSGTTCTHALDPATPHNTIAEGIACLSAGDTLYVRSGVYPVTLAIVGKVGTSLLPYTISGYPGDTPPIIRPASSGATSGTNRGYIISGSQHVVVRGLEFDGANTILSPSLANPSGQSSIGNTVESSSFITLEDNEIHHMRGNGAYITTSNNITLRRNHMHHQVSECVPGSRWYGIYFHDGNNSIIEDSDIEENPGGGMQLYPGSINGLTVRGNRIHRNNTCTSSDPFGGLVIGPESASQIVQNIDISNNLIYKNGDGTESSGQAVGANGQATGIVVYGKVTNLKLENNTIHANRVDSVDGGGGHGIQFVQDAGNNTGATPSPIIRNNLVTANGGTEILTTNATTPIVEGNGCTGVEACGTTDKLTITGIDDCFVDAANDDYTQKSTSTCRDEGVATGKPFNEAVLDIGRYEYFVLAADPIIDLNVMEFTLGINVPRNVPATPATGVTGLTVGCTGTGCGTTIATAQRKPGSDTTFQIVISGISGNACNAGTQVYTLSYNSATGNILDAAGQPLHSFTNRAVTEQCTGTPPTAPPTAGLVVDYVTNENAGTSVNDQTAENNDGTLTGSPLPAWVVGFDGGSALSYASGINAYLALPVGSGWNPITNSITVCGETEAHDPAAAQKIWFSVDNGTNQRAYVGQIGGTMAIGIQASGFATGSEFALTAGKHVWCLRFDNATPGGGTGTAELFWDGTKGTGAQVKKTYTSYALASNWKVGVGTFDVNYGGSTTDRLKVFFDEALTDQEILDITNAWTPVPAPPTGVYILAAARGLNPWLSGGNLVYLDTLNTPLSIRRNGYFAVDVQIDGDGAAIEPAAFRMHYQYQCAGSLFTVPDVFGEHKFRFLGTSRSGPALATTPPDYRLTGAKTILNGQALVDSSAVPVTTFTDGSSVVLRYFFQVGPDSTTSDYWCLVPVNQNGTSLDSLTPAGGVRVNVQRSNGSGS